MIYYKRYSPQGPIKDRKGRTYHLYRGKPSNLGDEYYHKWIQMNIFSEMSEKIPGDSFRIKGPSKNVLKDGIYDPSKKQALKVYMPERTKDARYVIHGGGKRPFIVYVSQIFKDVYVYRIPSNSYVPENKWSQNFNDNIAYYSEMIMEIYPIDVFPGIDRGPSQAIGNTVLVACRDRTYVYIGPIIYRFDADEEIYAYFSFIDADDIPHPVGVGVDRLYFFDSKCSISRINFPDLNIKNLGKEIFDRKNITGVIFRNLKILG
jgi:hypothetical protein